MKQLARIRLASVGIIAVGLLGSVPEAKATTTTVECYLDLDFHYSQACDTWAFVRELRSCGKCSYYNLEDEFTWMHSCPQDAPEDCVILETTESCGYPEEYCEEYIEDCEETLIKVDDPETQQEECPL